MTEKGSRAFEAFSNYPRMIRFFVMAWTGVTNPRPSARFDWLHIRAKLQGILPVRGLVWPAILA
jgi:hypothetical protein